MKKLSKSKFKHYMLAEIFEQPEILKKILATYVDFDEEIVTLPEFEGEMRRIKRIKKFIFLGCGSSANASLLGNYYFEELTGKNSEYEYADEFISRRAVLERDTAVILLSQSGATKDVLLAAEIARHKGAFIIAITNTPGSRLDRMSDVTINTQAGFERGIAATKSFSSQILVLLLLALFFARIFGNKIIKKSTIYKELKELVVKQNKTLEIEKHIIKLAKAVGKKKGIIVTGRKYNFPIALEGAHKLKETAYIHAEGIASEELRHGGEAMLDKSFLVLCLAPSDSVFKDNLLLLKELKRTKSTVYVLSDNKTQQLKNLYKTLPLIKTIDILMPLVSLIPLQLLAYHLALVRGIDIDNPRNITKFVS